MHERRSFKRYEAALDTRYMKVIGCVTLDSVGVTKNVGFGGVCTTLNRLIKKGDELLIDLDIPLSGKGMATLVRVVWERSVDDNRRNMCGMRFLWVSSEPLLDECVAYAREASTVNK